MLIRICIPMIEKTATIVAVVNPADMFSLNPIPRARTIPAIAFMGCTANGYPNHDPATILASPVKTSVLAKSMAPICARAMRIGRSVPKSPRLPETSASGLARRCRRFHCAIEPNVRKASCFCSVAAAASPAPWSAMNSKKRLGAWLLQIRSIAGDRCTSRAQLRLKLCILHIKGSTLESYLQRIICASIPYELSRPSPETVAVCSPFDLSLVSGTSRACISSPALLRTASNDGRL
jgi:hypothetical protein